MKAYVITIEGLTHSEQCAHLCSQSGRRFGVQIKQFPATNRYQAKNAMVKYRLSPNSSIYRAISDLPIGDRDDVPKGQWELTTPELGCFMSHYRIWRESMKSNQDILVLEHDTVLVAAIPELVSGAVAANFDNIRYAGTAGYVITPEAAILAVTEAYTNGVQPSDELLWRTALKDQKIFIPPFQVIKILDGGVSTIQWTRSDHVHEKIVKKDPWSGFRER